MIPKKKRIATKIAPSAVLRFTDTFEITSSNLILPREKHRVQDLYFLVYRFRENIAR